MFYEQLQNACKLKGIKLTPLVKELGMASANIGRWKQGGTPSVEVLNSLSVRLGVSTDYLLGNTDNPTPADKQPPDYIVNISDLNEKDRKEVLAIIEMKRANK